MSNNWGFLTLDFQNELKLIIESDFEELQMEPQINNEECGVFELDSFNHHRIIDIPIVKQLFLVCVEVSLRETRVGV